MTEKIKLGVYRHYKNKDYKVFFVAKNSETEQEEVIYEDSHKQIWARPKEIFFGQVEVDGKKVNRFEYIGSLENEDDSDDFEAKYKRALADYQNLLKQTAKEKMEFARFANEQMFFEILPVYDNLKTSIQFTNEVAEENGWLIGIKYIIKQFSDALKNSGIEEIIAVEKKFDHHLMEAIDNEETEDKKKDGFVAREVKSGYKLNGRVIIPAKVVVYKMTNK